MSTRQLLRLVILLLTGWVAGLAHAHKPSDSYLRLTVTAAGAIDGQWDIALRDLEETIGLDADGNGTITWGELRGRQAELSAYAFARLKLRRGSGECRIEPGPLQVDDHTDGAYAVLAFSAACEAESRRAPLEIEYRLFAETDPLHRGLLALSRDGRTRSAVLDPGAPPQVFAPQSDGPWRQFVDYLREGVWHIWIGFDHILFLVSLLLPAVLVWRHGERTWAPAGSLRIAALDVLKIVTAFTVAHSITLSLATLGVVALPSAVVESAIAASVVLAALNNLWPLVQGRRWAVAFGFGLVHGFGFASVLADLGLPQETLVLALLAFNVGVEIGQLAIVAVFLPLAFALRAGRFYRRVVFAGGSALIALLAMLWFLERAFDLKLLG